MNFLKAATDFIGGSLFGEIKDTVMAYLPPDLSPIQRAEIELKLQEQLHKKQVEANRVLEDASKALDARIAEQEGTAKDLQQFGWVGKIIVFLRGVQRPAWGFGTFWLDVQWFFGEHLEFTLTQERTLLVINILVLGFLFGERTMKNLTPLLTNIFGAKK
jgi:hypothetical protein